MSDAKKRSFKSSLNLFYPSSSCPYAVALCKSPVILLKCHLNAELMVLSNG